MRDGVPTGRMKQVRQCRRWRYKTRITTATTITATTTTTTTATEPTNDTNTTSMQCNQCHNPQVKLKPQTKLLLTPKHLPKLNRSDAAYATGQKSSHNQGHNSVHATADGASATILNSAPIERII